MRLGSVHILEASHLVHLELLRGKVAVLVRPSVVRELSDLALGFVLGLVIVFFASSRLANAVTVSSSLRAVVARDCILGEPLRAFNSRRNRSSQHFELAPVDFDKLALVVTDVDVLRLWPLRWQDLNALHSFLDGWLANSYCLHCQVASSPGVGLGY